MVSTHLLNIPCSVPAPFLLFLCYPLKETFKLQDCESGEVGWWRMMMVWRTDWQLWDLNLKVPAWGSLPYYFTEEQMQELLVSFGSLRGSDLVKDRDAESSEGYGLCVYQDPPLTDIAWIYRTGMLAAPWLLLLEELYIYGMPQAISTSEFCLCLKEKMTLS